MARVKKIFLAQMTNAAPISCAMDRWSLMTKPMPALFVMEGFPRP